MKKLTILYQSKELLAVDKPWGISVHNPEDQENLIARISRELSLSDLYPVHRLDKETSGVQLFALTSAAAAQYAKQFELRAVHKTYHAILRGELRVTSGLWRQSLSDKSEGRKNPAGLQKDRVTCETGYQVIESNSYFSFCEFDLKTGRQHQIRKHSAINRAAIVGDPRYGDKKYNLKMAALYKTQRMFLHCSQLGFEGLEIQSPLPEEFQRLFGASLLR